MSYLSNNLKFLRNGRRQEDCAAHIGVTSSCWSNWETKLSTPRVSTLQKLARFLGVTVAELLDIDLAVDSSQVNDDPSHTLNEPPAHYRIIMHDLNLRLTELEKRLEEWEQR